MDRAFKNNGNETIIASNESIWVCSCRVNSKTKEICFGLSFVIYKAVQSNYSFSYSKDIVMFIKKLIVLYILYC